MVSHGAGGRVATLETTALTTIPGIGTGVAYAAGDAVGTKFEITVPVKGVILALIFNDKDDEGIQMILVLFDADFTAAVDNAAWDVSDADMDKCVGYINLIGATGTAGTANVNYLDFGPSRIGQVVPPFLQLPYTAPLGKLYGQWLTASTPNIAAGSIPTFRMVIEVRE